jgi:hypothetical protein
MNLTNKKYKKIQDLNDKTDEEKLTPAKQGLGHRSLKEKRRRHPRFINL